MVEWLVWEREEASGFYVLGCWMAGLGEELSPTGKTPHPHQHTHTHAHPYPVFPALLSDYGNEKDHAEDNTSFNPGT